MRNRYKLFLFIIFLVVSLSSSFRLREKMIASNFDEEIKKITEVNIMLDNIYTKIGYYTDYIYNDDIKELDELYKESDIVIKGRPTTKKQDSQITQTMIEVEEVLYGDVNTEQITVIEQSLIIDGNRLLVQGGSVLPMIYEKEYILFLKRNTDYESGNVFRLTSMLYGKFPLRDEVKVYENDYPNIVGDDITHSYPSDVLEYDVAFLNIKDIALYEDGTYAMDDEYSKMRYEALVKYQNTFQDTYLKFYNELKLHNVIQQE